MDIQTIQVKCDETQLRETPEQCNMHEPLCMNCTTYTKQRISKNKSQQYVLCTLNPQ